MYLLCPIHQPTLITKEIVSLLKKSNRLMDGDISVSFTDAFPVKVFFNKALRLRCFLTCTFVIMELKHLCDLACESLFILSSVDTRNFICLNSEVNVIPKSHPVTKYHIVKSAPWQLCPVRPRHRTSFVLLSKGIFVHYPIYCGKMPVNGCRKHNDIWWRRIFKLIDVNVSENFSAFSEQ